MHCLYIHNVTRVTVLPSKVLKRDDDNHKFALRDIVLHIKPIDGSEYTITITAFADHGTEVPLSVQASVLEPVREIPG